MRCFVEGKLLDDMHFVRGVHDHGSKVRLGLLGLPVLALQLFMKSNALLLSLLESQTHANVYAISSLTVSIEVNGI